MKADIQQPALSELSNEQINRKVAKTLGWKEGYYASQPPQITWWHDDLGDGPPMDYCKVFGREICQLILRND